VVSNSTPVFVAGQPVAIVHFDISLEGTLRQLKAATEAGERIQVIDADTGNLVLDTASEPIASADPVTPVAPVAPVGMVSRDHPVAVAATNQNHWLVRGFVGRSEPVNRRALWSLAALVLATAIVLLAVAHEFARRLGRSISAVTRLSARLATGDLTEAIAVGGRDEIGAMAASLNTATARMADTVSIVITEAGAVAGSSRAITALGDRVALEADQVADRAITMGVAAQQISNEIQSMAAGVSQMHNAIDEIARRAVDAIDVAGEARQIAGVATAVVDELSGRAADITAMVALITAVAEQTNLLALNATIEAARAGAAGVGFAVVAAEVKSLSLQTKDAAAEIASRMSTFGADSERVRNAFSNISEIVERIHEMQTMVGAATEEQAVTMSELTRSVHSTAHVTNDLVVGIGEVADLSRQTRTAALASQSASRDLDQASARLHEGLAHFTTPATAHAGHAGHDAT
jgi:methyl-accepting chemotaxis protein